jgi:hypothetical protein
MAPALSVRPSPDSGAAPGNSAHQQPTVGKIGGACLSVSTVF